MRRKLHERDYFVQTGCFPEPELDSVRAVLSTGGESLRRLRLRSARLRLTFAAVNEAGKLMRAAFEEHMAHFGEDFHAAGETRRGVYSDHKGIKKISFLPGEFPLRAGDIIKRWATEENYQVLSAKAEAVAGVVINFHAVVLPA